MFIKSIELENYRCHAKSKIDFFPDGKPGNLSILEGVDGAGKTCIFNAIGWCLYGKETLELLGAKSQNLRIPNVANLDSSKPTKVSVEIWLEFETGDAINSEAINSKFTQARVLRTAMFRGSGIYDDELKLALYSSSEAPHLMHTEDAKTFIAEIAPKDLIEFYMFTGEYLSNVNNSNGANINASIQGQFKMGAMLSMKNLLDNLAEDYHDKAARKSGIDNSEIQANIDSIKDEILKNDEHIEKLLHDKQQYENDKKDAEQQMVKLRDQKKFIEGKNEALQELQQNKAHLTNIRKEKKEKLANMHKLLIDSGYLSLASNTIKSAYSKVRDEIGSANLPPNIKREFLEDLLSNKKCICGRTLQENSKEYNQILNLKNQSEIESQKLVLTELSPTLGFISSTMLKTYIGDLQTYQQDIANLISHEQEANEELTKFNQSVQSLDEEEIQVLDDYKKAEDNFEQFNRFVNDTQSEIKSCEEGQTSLENKLSELNKKQENSAKKYEEGKKLIEYKDKAKELGDIINRLREKIVAKFIAEFEKQANSLLATLSGLSHLSIRIKQNAGKIDVAYEDKYLSIESDAYLADGQQQIISIVLVAAYIKVLKTLGGGIAKAPFVVMDHPFSDLGLPRKEEILKSFSTLFKETKCIILTPPGDFDLNPISAYIASHYKIENDPKNKICNTEAI